MHFKPDRPAEDKVAEVAERYLRLVASSDYHNEIEGVGLDDAPLRRTLRAQLVSLHPLSKADEVSKELDSITFGKEHYDLGVQEALSQSATERGNWLKMLRRRFLD